jgi:multidrug efflux pump subunit AcrB
LDIAPGLRSADEVAATRLPRAGPSLTVGDVARVSDRGEEPSRLVFHGAPGVDLEPAVTLTVAKRPGANAVQVVAQALAKVEALRGRVIPAGVSVEVTRDYGRTAAEKSDELLLHMGIAVFGVTLLILLFLGWRESLVVLLAIPATLALTLLLFHQLGYTLNRITLFALIFSIGILVDDAIVVVENLVRHFRMPGARGRPVSEVALEAVDEVGNPTILATWAVIAAILPMAFVGGLMGPYMRPIPVGASAAMVFSLLVAFTVTPWAALRVIGRRAASLAPGSNDGGEHEAPDDLMTRLYRRYMEPLMASAAARWKFLGGIAALLVLSMALVPLGAVKVKMLPFDNKSEFQVVVRLPEGASLERAAAAVRDLTRALADVPEVLGWQAYLGTAAPFNFNGLVRHYYLRQGPNVADIQVNLADRSERDAQSHDVAKRVRDRLLPVARAHGAVIAVAEVPPGPPVLQTLVAEVYGPDETQRLALAAKVKETLAGIDGVVDVDWYVEAPHRRARIEVDADEAARLGVPRVTAADLLALAAGGRDVARLAEAAHPEPVPVRLELDPAWRQSPEALLSVPVRLADGAIAPAAAFARAVQTEGERSLYRKNLRPVTYVTADVAGAIESPAYALIEAQRRLAGLDARAFGAAEASLAIHHLSQPSVEGGPALKWDGEWHITLEVFRDLGLAFAAVLILIYGLMVGWFGNYRTPLVVMAAIPFSLVGILPAHALMGAFFTATSMIGFMAGAGIVVRNSIILVDFIELRRSQGLPLEQAVVEAGAVRFRPMLLTALAVVIGAAVILADPIFQGLAVSLLFGEIASLLISRMAVPVLHLMAERRA